MFTEDTYELLSTKLSPPRLHSLLVPREALLERLDEGLKQKLTLVSAPAGFGKTTLVGEWVADRRQAGSLLQVAWVALDEGDNDPVRFWRYVLTACRVFDAGICEPALTLLQNSPQPSFEALVTQFINAAAQFSYQGVLVLEDYHVISAQQIHEMLVFLIDHLPPTLHLVLMTRSDPPMPLARLRARNELNELRAADLRFTVDEIQSFLEQAVPFPLAPDVATRLAERTEGWAAGLRLVALALQKMKNQAEVEQYLGSFAGSHRPILEYLVDDVYSAQPESIQRFLLDTSILGRFTAPLCDTITDRQDSAQILDQLERANLFLVPLDDGGQWYRYHALFAEAMQQYARRRLGEARLNDLACKASFWYETHGYLAEAVESALSTGDHPRAAALIGRTIAPRLVQNEWHTQRRWLEQLPESVLRANPELCLPLATAVLFTSNRHAPGTKARLQLPLAIAEDHWRREGNRHRLGEVYAFRSLVAWLQREYAESFALARQALGWLPDTDRQWRGISLIMLGVDELMEGRLNTARAMLAEALALNEAAQNIYGTLDSMLLLGEVCYQQGELHQAEQIYRQVLARTEDAPMDRDQSATRRGRALLGLGVLALEWNDLAAADDAASEAVTAAQQFPEEDDLADSPVILAQVKYARGETTRARQIVETAVSQAARSLFRFPRVVQNRFALAAGDLDTVKRWAAAEGLSGEDVPLLQREEEAMVLARLRIELGEAEAAIQQLEAWLPDARDNGRTRSEIEITILLALAQAALKRDVQARQTLIQAVVRAHPEGYRRVFLDHGERVAMILREALPSLRSEPPAAYARDLLRLMAGEQSQQAGRPATSSTVLAEPLSDQERRVLRLLAAGLSNPEIAEQLVISINTVKTHVKNVYGKLGVSSRQEAGQVARNLSLL